MEACVSRLRLRHDLGEEGVRHAVLQQPLPVLGEGRRVEAAVAHVEVEEPLEEEVVLESLTELAFTAHREEGDQQAPLEQMLGWDRGASARGVHLVKER